MSAHPSLLESIVVTGGFCRSLLYYHCSDVVVATDRMPITTVVYDLFLQCCAVVVAAPPIHVCALMCSLVHIPPYMIKCRSCLSDVISDMILAHSALSCPAPSPLLKDFH
jgi:hypothetical protein